MNKESITYKNSFTNPVKLYIDEDVEMKVFSFRSREIRIWLMEKNIPHSLNFGTRTVQAHIILESEDAIPVKLQFGNWFTKNGF